MFKVEVDRRRRVVTFRASGTLQAEELQRAVEQARTAIKVLHPGQHIVLADLRGMAVMSPEAGEIFGRLIRFGRENGTALCVHLSDSSIARMQAARLAREVSPQDEITVNVVSIEEGERVIEERFRELLGVTA
jgi:hypothetical protein